VDEQSIWKKEISLKRKPKAPKPPPEPGTEQASVWKKEISFKRKPKAERVTVAEDARGAPGDAPKESLWKKEISFKRKPKAEPVAAADEPSAPDEPKQSIWKKEISFGKKPKREAAEPEPVAADEPVFDVSVADEPEPAPATEPPPVPEPVVIVPEPEPAPVFHAPLAEEPEPAVEPTAAPDLEPEPLPLPPPPPADPEPLPPAAETAPLAMPPTSVAPPTTVAPPPTSAAPPTSVTPATSVAPPPTSVSPPAGISVPPPVVPDPVAVPEPEVVHPPVPASALPPEPKDEKPVPFWKREFTLGRRGGPKQKAESEPKPKRTKAPKVKAERGGRGKKVVGLKIGASQLAAARVTNNGSAELLQVAREPLNPGVVVGGELRDPDALAIALKDFFTKHKLPRRGVRLGIANNRIGVRTFDVDGIADPKQLDNAIRFRAQEALPIPIDEAVLDYQILRESTNEEGQPTRRILLVVAYREQIDRYIDACRKAGIGLVGIDLEAFALLRALQAPQSGAGNDPDAALVAVAIGHERSTFAVSDGRVCEFTRVLEWGGAAINVAIARALDAAPSEVEGVKRALSLMDEMTPDGLTAEQAAKARDAIRRAIQTFVRELVSSLQFYQNQPGSLGIGEIVLTGGTTHLPGLASELEKLIGVRVRVGDPLARMKVSKKLGQPEQIGSFSVAIGLGIED
jgi:type IV pilus assembly protein PilM